MEPVDGSHEMRDVVTRGGRDRAQSVGPGAELATCKDRRDGAEQADPRDDRGGMWREVKRWTQQSEEPGGGEGEPEAVARDAHSGGGACESQEDGVVGCVELV